MKICKKYILLFLIILSVTTLVFKKAHENIENIEDTNHTEDNITVVSGYWKVNSKYNHDTYDNWFKNTLKINQRYIFFCDEKDIDYIKSFRNNYETIFINYPLDKFHSSQYTEDSWIHGHHSPSKKLSMVWHEKINMLKMAKDYDITQNGKPTEFYVWIDSGIATYRDKSPPSTRLNMKDIHSLPHDKLCYSGVFIPNDIMLDGSRADREIFAATSIIMHSDIIDKIHDLYYNLLENCNKVHVENGYCGSDQHVFTDMKDEHPELFYKMADGWGTNLEVLYNEHV